MPIGGRLSKSCTFISKNKRFLFVVLSLALLEISFLRDFIYLEKTGLDPSWMWAMNNIFAFVPGKDWAFTYGPLGFMFVPQMVGNNVFWANLLNNFLPVSLLIGGVGYLIFRQYRLEGKSALFRASVLLGFWLLFFPLPYHWELVSFVLSVCLNYEPWYKPGRIGPQTNERIFELLLRLRANTYWPAMHECSVPFFLTPGNREAAEKFGIYIGGSHCEPMACSTAGEWSRRGKGDYDYVKNSSSVCHFWEERLKEVSGQEILYTVGMRGVHDGQMQGAKTVEEQKAVLERVLKDQRDLLRKYVNKDVEAIPQVFIPYKEVLDIYRAGLEVPEDVTLMWCDDNYGYIKHFPTEVERTRKGGNGVYYHVSYWGRPHDYLWLGTFSPALLYQQMKEAYDCGIQKIWILNVGDIKPIEYQTELFLDMAWNIDQVIEEGVSGHLCNFLKREFGEAIGEDLLPVMMEHYRLSYIRKPEFMGNTREEEYHTNAYRIVKDMPWSRSYINKRLEDYQVISDKVEKLASRIQQDRQDAYFQLIKYPVQATAEMNKKMLYAQFARHGEMNWNKSDVAYDSIASLTRIYNIGIRNNGKWHRMMDHQPRRLPVFEPVDRSSVETPMLEDSPGLYKWNGAEYSAGDAVSCEGLGYEEKAVMLEKNKELSFDFGECPGDSVEVEIRLLPNHPIHGGQLRFSVSIDKKNAQTVSYETQGRSEEWKENVLRNQAIRRVVLPVKKRKNHNLTIKALDEGVVIDQIEMYQLN